MSFLPVDIMSTNTYRTRLTRDLRSRVARQLGRSRSQVLEAAKGHSTSACVERDLANEYTGIGSEAQRFKREAEEVAA
jgi:hypothetical protein